MNAYELDQPETERQRRGQPKSKTSVDSNAVWLLMEFIGVI